MIAVEELDRILDHLSLTRQLRKVALSQALGETLGAAVEADRDIPPFDRVCMDGYALRWDEWEAGRREYFLSGSSPAGALRHPGPDPGGCVEVMTGAPCPVGCDLVIRKEDARANRSTVRLDPAKVMRGQNLAWRGSDARAGRVVLEEGVRLGPAEIAILASLGSETVLVRSKPRIAVATTGDELVEVGRELLPHQIHRSNDRFLEAALVARGFSISTSVHLPDDPELLEAGLGELLRTSDIVLVAGGVSVSSRDFVPQVLALLGCECLAHGVAQKPGKPLWVGTGPGGQIVFALPGNPVAVAMCFVRHVLGVLLRDQPSARTVRLGESVEGLPNMTKFSACKVRDDGQGGSVASVSRGNGSGDFLQLAGADGFLEIPPGSEFAAGSVVRFWPW